MKNFILLIAVVAGLAGVGGFLIVQKDAKLDEALYEKKLRKAQLAFAMQMPVSIQSPDEKVNFDRRQVMKEHREAVAAIFKEHPAQNIQDRFIVEREAQAKEGKKDKKKVAEYRERYDYLKERFAVLKAQTYEPVLSAYSNGMRFDIQSISKGDDGKLRVDIFIWGGVKGQLTFGAFSIKYPIVERDDRGKIKGDPQVVNIDGAGPPFLLHEDGHEWIPEWPPGVSVGYYVGLPLFAPQAEKFNLSLEFTHRTTGGTAVPFTLEWKGVEVKSAWMDPDKSKWEGVETADASDEDLKEFGLE
jgi:hypothetical protein